MEVIISVDRPGGISQEKTANWWQIELFVEDVISKICSVQFPFCGYLDKKTRQRIQLQKLSTWIMSDLKQNPETVEKKGKYPGKDGFKNKK